MSLEGNYNCRRKGIIIVVEGKILGVVGGKSRLSSKGIIIVADQEALARYRRKGEQKVVVQHVNVNDGGKAIVGNMIS